MGEGFLCAGDLILEGGGFCGARTTPLDLDLSAYDGISLRVRADAQAADPTTFKFNLKTVSCSIVLEYYNMVVNL